MKSENLEQTFLCCIVSERQAVWLVVFLHKQKFNKQEEGCFRTFGHQMNVTRNYFIFAATAWNFNKVSLSLSISISLSLFAMSLLALDCSYVSFPGLRAASSNHERGSRQTKFSFIRGQLRQLA
jgi:hypothetical protein